MKHTNPGDADTIQLLEDAVHHLLPPYATESDMYEALDRCGLTQRQIFDELDRTYSEPQLRAMSEGALAEAIHTILFSNFVAAIDEVTAHKAPLYG